MKQILNHSNKIEILDISDTHVGSVSALLPDKATRVIDGSQSSAVPQNRIQRLLWQLFLRDLSKVGKVDVVINNGDNIEGQQLKIAGRTLMDSDVDSQIEWALQVQQKVIDTVKPKFYIGCAGTDYHVTTSGNADLQIYKRLEAANPSIDFTYEDIVEIQIGKMAWSIAHPVPTSEMILPPLEKLIKQHATECYLGNAEKIRVFSRGHAHSFVWSALRGNNYAFIVPCWQPTSKYGRSKAYLTVRKPDVGLLKITQVGEQLTPSIYLHPEVHNIIN